VGANVDLLNSNFPCMLATTSDEWVYALHRLLISTDKHDVRDFVKSNYSLDYTAPKVLAAVNKYLFNE
jgi:hypothetical protein